jgi:hypothetical protein
MTAQNDKDTIRQLESQVLALREAVEEYFEHVDWLKVNDLALKVCDSLGTEGLKRQDIAERRMINAKNDSQPTVQQIENKIYNQAIREAMKKAISIPSSDFANDDFRFAQRGQDYFKLMLAGLLEALLKPEVTV